MEVINRQKNSPLEIPHFLSPHFRFFWCSFFRISMFSLFFFFSHPSLCHFHSLNSLPDGRNFMILNWFEEKKTILSELATLNIQTFFLAFFPFSLTFPLIPEHSILIFEIVISRSNCFSLMKQTKKKRQKIHCLRSFLFRRFFCA